MRRPTVTRTISTLNITVLGMDTVSCEPMTMTFPVYESEAPKDEAKLFNYIRKSMRQIPLKSQQSQTRRQSQRHTQCHSVSTLKKQRK